MISFKVAGLMSQGDEVTSLRPTGYVLLQAEPENEYDSGAVAVYYNDVRVGYVPKKGNYQKQAIKAMKAKVVACSYVHAYVDGKPQWNDDGEGELRSIRVEIEAEKESASKVIGGHYLRVTSFLKHFDPYGGSEGLIRWAFSQGETFDEYKDALTKCADDGTLMHDEIEGYFKTGEFTEGRQHLPEGWNAFVDKFEPEFIFGEERFYDSKLMVTGQPDFVGYVTFKGRRVLAVVDWKSSKKPSLKHKLQASIYASNVEWEGEKPEIALIVAFGADNKQRFSASAVSADQIGNNYKAMLHVKRAMELVGVRIKPEDCL
tara:strand:+ start:1663 stop:2613 length:951 start_codon:yes stop_codon:yes gene_type:complete